MTTEPGDLVLDPTGGSGTTASVAETWGRRWISIDSSPASIALSRQRVLAGNYPVHLLVGSEEGFLAENEQRKQAGMKPLAECPLNGQDPASGIVIRRMPHITAAFLAYQGTPEGEKYEARSIRLVDQPVGGKDKGRVCGPFTVESETSEKYRSPAEISASSASGKREADRDAFWQQTVIRHLREAGIGSSNNGSFHLEGLEENSPEDNGIRACRLHDPKQGKKIEAALAILPEDAKGTPTAIIQLIDETKRSHRDAEALVVAAVEFHEAIFQNDLWDFEIHLARVGAALHATETTATKGSSSVTLVAQPLVEISPAEEQPGHWICKIKGWLEVSPFGEGPRQRQPDDIDMWLLDADYDSTQFCASSVHLPRLAKAGRSKADESHLKSLMELLNDRKIPQEFLDQAVLGLESAPFPAPKSGKICIRLVTRDNGTMSWVEEIPSVEGKP